MDISRLLTTATTADIYDLITIALGILDAREQPPTEDDRLSAEVLAQHAMIARDRETGKFGTTYYSEASAVLAAAERGRSTRADELAAKYDRRARGGA